MSNRLSALQSEIANRHIESKRTGVFNCRKCSTAPEIINAIVMGETNEVLLYEIEMRYVSITSILMSNPATFGHISDAYVKAVRHGFKVLLDKHKIK
jgi:hypothetical protein